MKQLATILIGMLFFIACQNDKVNATQSKTYRTSVTDESVAVAEDREPRRKELSSVDCEKMVDSILGRNDLCEKSFVPFLSKSSVRCGQELYDQLVDKAISQYQKSKLQSDYQKLECISKRCDGALSEYAGLVLVRLFAQNPATLTASMFEYERVYDTSYVKGLIILDGKYFGGGPTVRRSIKSILSTQDSLGKSYLEGILRELK